DAAAEIARIVAAGVGIGVDVGPVAGPVGSLRDREVVAALVRGVAVAEIHRGQHAVEEQLAVRRRPVLLVQHVDALRAYDPALLRQVVGSGVGFAQRPVEGTVHAIHAPARAGVAGHAGFQHVLGGAVAPALGGAELEHEPEPLARVPFGIHRDVPGGGRRAGAGDHVVHA